MLAAQELQRVPPSRGHADRLLNQAERHIDSAGRICESDVAGGYALAYDAARKALPAVLENEGLRPSSRGGHPRAIIQVARNVLEQMSPY